MPESYPYSHALSSTDGRRSASYCDEPWLFDNCEWYNEREIPVVLEYLENIPDRSLASLRVLELACGTGFATLPLTAGEHSILATDPSDDLLRALERRLAGEGDSRSRTSTRRMDMGAFLLEESFKAVCILGASVMLFSPAERLVSFEHAARHLPAGGALIVSTRHVLPQAPARSTTTTPDGVVVTHEVDHSAGRITTLLRCSRQSVIRERHLVTPADLVHDMQAVGLTLASQHSEPVPNQPFHIWSIVGAINRG